MDVTERCCDGEIMSETQAERGTFTALLKYWRRRRGFSQLDLALAADVSSRHVSFLETGRSRPGQDMVLRLAGALDVPLQEQNVMLRAAGFEPAFDEPGPSALPGPIRNAIARMLEHQEPYPLTVFDRGYRLLQANAAAFRLLSLFIADPAALPQPINVMEFLFDPEQGRPFVRNWEAGARQMLARLHREALARPNDELIQSLRDRLLAYPGVPGDWHVPDLSERSLPCLELRLVRDDLELGFLTTITYFSAPQNVTLQDLFIESFYPLDDRTAELCAQLASR